MRVNAAAIAFTLVVLLPPAGAWGAPFVPGTGEFLDDCSDDFENEDWSYRYNHPKSSYEQDENQRGPGGFSNNGLWHEGGKRGTPDLVKRVETPPGGLEGSGGALLMRTRLSGIPGKLTGQQQQDDLLMKFDRKLGRVIPVAWRPSCTVRVYLPAFEQWENRSGPSFGVRADCRGRNPDGDVEPYWPGMFILFRSETSRNIESDFAQITVRANRRGQDMRSIELEEPGWVTMGMSFTPDGQIHYYASKGVDDLTEEDYLTSQYAYSWRCLTFNNFFFNVANWDNGRSWSTPWVIDDPKIYVQPPAGYTVDNLYRNRGRRHVQHSTVQRQSRPTRRRSTSSASRQFGRRSRR